MPEIKFFQETENGMWKKAFLVISLSILILLPIMSRDYGQSGDEWVQMEYGHDIWNYFTNGDKQALDYSNRSLQYSSQEYYGGFFDFSMDALHHAVPGVNIVILRHFFNALMSALLMVFTGLLARKLSGGKWSVGLLALIFILFSPRILGEGMNNPKDIPFACGFIIGVYGIIGLLFSYPNKPLKYFILMAIGWGISFGIRPGGGLLVVAYMGFFSVLYYILNKDFRAMMAADKYKYMKRFILGCLVVFVAGFLIGLSTWPLGQQDPFGNFSKAMAGMANRDVFIATLFEGKITPGNKLPWYYEAKWMMMSNPLIVIAGLFAFVALIKFTSKTYGWFAVIVVLFACVFPLFYVVYKKSTVFDTWRHMIFVYPYWVIAAALAFGAMQTFFIKNEKMKWVPFGVAILGLLPAIIWTVRSHPNQYVYFNETVGGIKGAFGNFDTDYYQNTNKQAADYIIKHAKHIPGRKVLVRSNMGPIQNYLGKDSSWIESDYGRYNERHEKVWDYFISYSRAMPPELLLGGKWPPKNTWHIIEQDGVPLCAIQERKSTEGIAAGDAYKRNSFDTAIVKYEAYLKADPDDANAWLNYAIALAQTNNVDKAIPAFNTLLTLDPSMAESLLLGSGGKFNVYDVLASMYQAKGDAANANANAAKGKELLYEVQAKQQEEAETE